MRTNLLLIHTWLKWKAVARIVFFSVALLMMAEYSNAQAPAITSFTPAKVCTGETVTITGTDFTGATSVKLGGVEALSFKVNSATNITAVAASASNGVVTVTTPKGTSPNSATSLTVITAPFPVLTDAVNLADPFTNCDGNSTYQLKVKNGSACGSGACNYDINWGDNSAHFTQSNWASGATIDHTYNAQGYFNITLSITSDNGCVKSKTYSFYNGTNPLASLTTTSSTTGLCAPATIEFQIGNWFKNSPGTTYHLDYGDGTPEVILPHPLNATNTVYLVSHTYTTTSCPSSPDFTATLRAVNGCFTTTYTLNQIVIRKKPVADFSTTPEPACLNTPICFTNLTTGGYSGNSCSNLTAYKWDFGDGTTSDLATPPCHTYASVGPYTVTLTATNSACGDDTKTKIVNVKPVTPPPTLPSNLPINYCQNQTAVPLTATGTSLLWYTSLNGFGSPTPITPSTFFPGNFTYYVTQTLNGCESPKVPITVNVSAAPNPPLVTSPVQYCQNQTASPLTATGTGLLWYTAVFGGTGSTTAPTPVTSALTTTTYYVSQTAAGCESNRAIIDVIVNSLAVPPVVTPNITYCQNEVVGPLTASGSSLLWYTAVTGGTGNPVAPIPSTATVATTDYYVSQVTGCGESGRSLITVTIKPKPSATISYTPVNLCNVVNTATTPNLPIDVVLTGTTGGFFSISPPFGLPIDPTKGQLNPSGAQPGQYIISYTIPGSGSCSDFVTTATVNVNGSPTATLNYPASICTSDAVQLVQLTGSTGGDFTSTAGLSIDKTTGAITPGTSTPGPYVITYTIAASPPCPGFTTTTNVTIAQAPSATIHYNVANLCNIPDAPATPNGQVAVVLTGTGRGTYSITPSSGLPIDPASGKLTPSGATAGAYTITYTIPGAGGCPDFLTTTNITVSDAPTATISYPGSPYCGGINTPQPIAISGIATGTFSSSADLSIDPATGAINPSLSKPGTYTVTYTILASPPCPGFVTTTSVTINESPVISFAVNAKTICSGQSVVFTPISTVANTLYNWSVAGGVLPAGVDGPLSGATLPTDNTITIPYTNTAINPQTISIEVVPANPLQSTCTGAPYTLTATINPIPAAPTVKDTVNYCLGTPGVPLTAVFLPGNHLNWFDENMVPLPAAPVPVTTTPAQFIYYVSQSNSQCESPKAKITAIVYPTPKIVSSSFVSPTTCGIPSGSVSLNILDLNNNPIPSTPVTIHYDKFQTAYSIPDTTDASGNIKMPLTAGTYTGMYVDVQGCASQKIPDVFVLKDPTPPAKPSAGYNPPVCTETILNLSASSATSTLTDPVDYVWVGPAFGNKPDTTRNTVFSFPSASTAYNGTYIVYAIRNNCISPETSFQVNISQSPTKPIITTKAPLCIGDVLNLQSVSSLPGSNPNATLNYTWTGPGRGFPVNAANAQIDKVVISDGGMYTSTVYSPATGCSAKTDTMIAIGGYPIVNLGESALTLPAGHILKLNPVIVNKAQPHILPIQTYEWSPNTNIDCNDAACSLPSATIKNDICYAVKATNIYGCSGGDTVCIKVFCEQTQVFIPNTFTPQGGLPENSVLMVRGSGIGSIKSFRVFNRWGQIVFERSNFPPNVAAYGWDGTVNGKPAEPAVYVYTAEVVCENGVPFFYKGNVTLIK